MTFAEQLKSARERLGLTQAECAELLEMSKRWLEKCEHGYEPHKITQEGALARLANAGRPKKTKETR